MATQMHFQYLKISKVLPNPENPRVIKDHKYKALVKSIKEFPKMLEIRPIVVNSDMIILGGNMRLRACQEAGLKDIPVIIAKELTESEQREFTIKDNVSFGEWDWDALANDWDDSELNDWGLDVWKKAEEIDYSILNGDDLSSDLSDMTKNIKKAIQIEFEMEHYEAAQELVKWWREQGLYIGGFLMEKLKEEKEKNV
jgi:ParB-like chromosome segregation protein Spo0J